jgi:hypothetical protein
VSESAKSIRSGRGLCSIDGGSDLSCLDDGSDSAVQFLGSNRYPPLSEAIRRIDLPGTRLRSGSHREPVCGQIHKCRRSAILGAW